MPSTFYTKVTVLVLKQASKEKGLEPDLKLEKYQTAGMDFFGEKVHVSVG